MPIPSANFPAVILLCELDLQCKLIARAAEYLEGAAAHWIAVDQGVDDGKKSPPLDIVATCTVCLSAAAAISRLLFLGGRSRGKPKRIAKRCEALMTLLEHPNLIALGELAVRNSWEHLDERLDEVLHSGTCKSHSEIHVSVVPPEPHTFVNRNFDPLALSIKHGPDAVLLRPLLAESRDLSKRIGKAFLRLQTEAHDPY